MPSSLVQFIRIPRGHTLNLRSLLCHDLSLESAIRHSHPMFSLSVKKGELELENESDFAVGIIAVDNPSNPMVA